MIVTFQNREGVEVQAEAYCERKQEARQIPCWHISATFPRFLHGKKYVFVPSLKPPVETRIREYGFDNACASFLAALWDMELVKGIDLDLGDEVVGVVEED